MAHNDAYKLAEKKIAEALKSGSNELDLSTEWIPLKGQELNELPESLGQCENLEVLKLSGNQLSELPASLHQLTKLKLLDLSGNQFENIPHFIANLASLRSLNLESNAISLLPDWIGCFPELTDFNVDGNRISKLPASFGDLKKLKCVYLGGNSFNSIPSELRNLVNIEWLDISRADLTSVPEWLSTLKLLYGLRLGSNWIANLPDAFCDISSLEYLDLSENELSQLPDLFGRLFHLAELNLSDNKLSSLPNSIGTLKRLTRLEISDNQVTELPESIGELNALESLDVSKNNLLNLPESIGGLNNLTTLDLSNNLLSELPKSIGELKKLDSLDVSSNGLTSLPDSIGKLKSLTTLEIPNNRLASISVGVCAASSLQSLNLARNSVKVLPEELGNLTELYGLDARGNQLSNLPASISELKALRVLYLAENPLNPELAAVFEDGIDALKRYARAKAEANVVLNEAKLIMIGEGEVGKSCLLAALRGEKWIENRNTTHGIEIKPVSLKHPDTGAPIILNGWDFGGQRVYRPTHQLFFTAPAVYLVVWKPREGSQQGFVKEWIKLVKHREPDAKIIIVATHGGPKDRQPDIDRQEMWDLFGKETVVDFFHVDSCPPKLNKKSKRRTGTRKGIDALKTTIACVAASLPDMGRTFPKRWQEARDALRNNKAAHLRVDEAFSICQNYGLNTEDARLLIRICRRVGDLIHYEYDPILRDVIILKPDWLATAISFVLDDKETRDVGHGLVKFDRLKALWHDPRRPKENRYPPEFHSIFLRLMERFDLSYRIAERGQMDAEGSSLIAQLVPDVRPEKALTRVWPAKLSPGDELQVQVCRIVETANNQSATAEGLFFQLIVRLHKYSLGRANFEESVHWQRGLVLEDDTGARAFLEHVGNDVRITVRSPYPARFLAALTYEVKWLVEDFWKGMRCEVTVPCLTQKPNGDSCKGLFEVAKLLENKKRGRPDQPCPMCNEWQDIEQLLHNAPAARPNPIDELLANSVETTHRLEALRQQLATQQAQIIGRFDQVDAANRELVSKVEVSYAGLIRMFSDEGKDAPRLFTLQPIERSGFNPSNWVKKKFRVTLWCEHTRLPLPLLNKGNENGVYEFEATREWFSRAAPLLKVIVGTLSLVLPVAASASKLAVDEAIYKEVESQLDFGRECAEAMLNAGEKAIEWLGEQEISEEDRTGVIRAQGGAMREFQSWLKIKDPSFADLRRVLNKRQEFLWVHRNFVGEY
jgi:Leucine-rich repeat (LRR) protein